MHILYRKCHQYLGVLFRNWLWNGWYPYDRYWVCMELSTGNNLYAVNIRKHHIITEKCIRKTCHASEIKKNDTKKLFITWTFCTRILHRLLIVILNDWVNGSSSTITTNETKETFHPIIFVRELRFSFYWNRLRCNTTVYASAPPPVHTLSQYLHFIFNYIFFFLLLNIPLYRSF